MWCYMPFAPPSAAMLVKDACMAGPVAMRPTKKARATSEASSQAPYGFALGLE